MRTRPPRRRVAIRAALVLAAAGLVAAVATAAASEASPYRKLSAFARVLALVERNHVDEVDGEALIVGAIDGMLRTLDPHSAYLEAEDFEILEDDTHGRFGGVGIEVGVRDDALTVIAPIPGTPAERAGVEPLDRIVRIEGRPTSAIGLEDAVRIMRGPIGTEVTIAVERDGRDEPLELTLVREEIEVESVDAELIAPGFVHVRVRAFQDATAGDAREVIERLGLHGGGLEGVLLDLRRNPGGLLEEAVRLADLFLAGGTIVTTRGRGGVVISEHTASARGDLEEVPLVVLVDAASASAAEIVAGALQDAERGIVAGTRTFGKGSVQSLIPLAGGAGLKLTVARYYTPSGRSIQAQGIVPDVLVESLDPPVPDEETRALQAAAEKDLPGALAPEGDAGPAPLAGEEIEDYQLRMGFQILRGLARAAREAPAKGDAGRGGDR